MKILQRGSDRQFSLSLNSESTLFRFGQPSGGTAPGKVLSVLWEDDAPSVVLHGEDAVPLSSPLIQMISHQQYLVYHEKIGSVMLVRAPWWQTIIPREFDGILMSYQGWHRGVWHDGYWGQSRAGLWTDLVGPGQSFRLRLGGSGSVHVENESKAWVEDERPFATKSSLVQAVQHKFQFTATPAIVARESHRAKETLLNLLLLRLAFPRLEIYLETSEPSWKRLAQNLSIIPLRQLPKRMAMEEVPLAIEWGNQAALDSILQWQMKRSPFIPANLWASLNERV